MGKQIAAIIVALIVLAVAIIGMWGQIVAIYFVVPGVILVLAIGLFSVQRSLDKHPNLALLEGSEYLEYKILAISDLNNNQVAKL